MRINVNSVEVSRTLIYFGLLALALSLAGCGPSIKCTQGVDGDRLLESLSRPELSIDAIAKNTAQLLTACEPKPTQQAVIDIAIEKVAVQGPAQLQADFYSALSKSAPQSPARLNFIEKSSLIAGTAKTSQGQIRLVEFESLGVAFDPNSTNSAIAAELKALGLNEGAKDQLRQIQTDAGLFLLARSFSNPQGQFEISGVRYYELESGRRIKTPQESLDFVFTNTTDNTLKDYFFSCGSYGGGLCGTRDTRYGIDESGKLKFIASVLYRDLEDGQCGVQLDVLRLDGKLIKPVFILMDSKTVACTAPPTREKHGDPFAHFLEADVAQRLTRSGGYPNVAELVNVKRQDAGDTALKTKLWAQKAGWKVSLLDRAIEPLNESSFRQAKTVEDAVDSLRLQVDLVKKNISNVLWLVGNPSIEPKSPEQLATFQSELDSLKAKTKAVELPIAPPPVKEPFYPYERVSIGIAREIQANDAGVVRLPDTPYMYFGVRINDRHLVILSSQKSLVSGPNIVNVLASRGQAPIPYMYNGFTQNIWMYRTLSDTEMAEYEEYQKQKKSHQKKMIEFQASRKQLISDIEEHFRTLLKLDAGLQLFVNELKTATE